MLLISRQIRTYNMAREYLFSNTAPDLPFSSHVSFPFAASGCQALVQIYLGRRLLSLLEAYQSVVRSVENHC